MHAGFGVALTVRQRLLNDALLIGYTGSGFPRNLTADLPFGGPEVAVDVFIAPPTMTCNNNDTLTFVMELRGALTITQNGVEETRNIAGKLTVRLKLSFEVLGKNLNVFINDYATDLIATGWEVRTTSGSFSPEAWAYISGDEFRLRLQKSLAGAVAQGLLKLPSIDVSFLGPILDVLAGTLAQSRVVGGAILIGIDIATDGSDPDLGQIETHGDINQLDDFARDNDLAAVTNAVAIPALLHEMPAKVRAVLADIDASLDGKLTIAPQNGQFHVSGHASTSFGSGNFSFNLVPQLQTTRPGKQFQYLPKPRHVNARTWQVLSFVVADMQTETSPNWMTVVGVIALLLTLQIPELLYLIDLATVGALNAEKGADTGSPSPRVQHLKSKTPGGADVRIAIEQYEITTAGTYIGLTVRASSKPGALLGLVSIPETFRSSSLGYSVRLPLGVRLEDPALRIRWTVIDGSGNQLVTDDGAALGRDRFSFEPDSLAPGENEFGVGVRVYRAIGPQITDLLNDNQVLTIRGVATPGSYVRWYYDVKNPQVTFDKSVGEWAYLGEQVARRHSNWHRLDRPCTNASKRSRYTYQDQVVDELPFGLNQINLHRSELCDYCFYGGPGGERPSL